MGSTPRVQRPALGGLKLHRQQQKVDEDDPIADEEWSNRYEAEMEEEERRNLELRNRFNGKTEVCLW